MEWPGYEIRHLKTKLKEAEAQNKKLVEWIQNKGHLIGCAKAIRKKCNCGHDELLKPTTDTTTEK